MTILQWCLAGLIGTMLLLGWKVVAYRRELRALIWWANSHGRNW